MFKLRGALFSGHDECTQINAIFDVLGVPGVDGWVGRDPFKAKFNEFRKER